MDEYLWLCNKCLMEMKHLRKSTKKMAHLIASQWHELTQNLMDFLVTWGILLNLPQDLRRMGDRWMLSTLRHCKSDDEFMILVADHVPNTQLLRLSCTQLIDTLVFFVDEKDRTYQSYWRMAFLGLLQLHSHEPWDSHPFDLIPTSILYSVATELLMFSQKCGIPFVSKLCKSCLSHLTLRSDGIDVVLTQLIGIFSSGHLKCDSCDRFRRE
jgi:hypothetical protein